MSTAIDYRDHTPVYDFNAIIAENIRALAARRGETQSSIARAIGIQQATVSLRWRGGRAWPIDDVARVAAFLGTTPWELCQPSPDYGNGGKPTLTAVRSLPQLDSNQQPFDSLPGAGAKHMTF